MVLALGIIVICVAVGYYRSADALGLMMEQRDAKRRFTAKWYSRHVRVTGVFGVLLGILSVLLGAALLLKPS